MDDFHDHYFFKRQSGLTSAHFRRHREISPDAVVVLVCCAIVVGLLVGHYFT